MRKGSAVHVKSQVDIEGEPETEPNRMIDEEKIAFNDYGQIMW